MSNNGNDTAEQVHPSHRIRQVKGMASDNVCELCWKTDNPLGLHDGGRLGELAQPCTASDDDRRRYDEKLAARKALPQERVFAEINFDEVRQKMLPAFIDEVKRCSSTLLDLGLDIHVFGWREYAGEIRYFIAVSLPKSRADKTTQSNIRRWFEDGTW